MNPAGVALFVFVASMNTLPQQQVVLAPSAVASPDHAPPHPLTHREPEASFRGPLVDLARFVGSIAKGALRDHGR
jgi:hypothetical protein